MLQQAKSSEERPRRQWWMLPGWLMNSVQNRITQEASERPRERWRVSSLSLRISSLKLMRMLSAVVAQQWLNLKHESESWRLSSAVFRQGPERTPRDTRNLRGG